MNLAELLNNEDLRRHEFPVVRDKVFLAHAGDSPLPRRVAEAVSSYALAATTADQEALVYPAILEKGRNIAARLLQCQPSEVGFVGPTSLALSFIASGLRFRRSENIVIYFDDYPSNVYPWMALAEQGIEVRLMNTRGLGVIRPRDVIGQIDENTRLVALATCHFVSGYRLEIETVGKALRQRGILFCLDAIQTLGAFPTTTEYVDLLAADAHKWLLGPCGAGLMYVKQSVQEFINPPIYGWNNVQNPNFVAQEQIVFRSGAHKYEAGTYNLLGLVGLIESMEMILELGLEAISAHLLKLRAVLAPGLQAKGYTVLNADAPPQNASAIVSFHQGDKPLAPLHERLRLASVITSLRCDRSGRQYIRLSPHFYNTEPEMERVLALL